MKILALSPGYIPIPSGAYFSLHETLKFLHFKNISSAVLTVSDNSNLINFFPDRAFDENIDNISVIKCKAERYLHKLYEIISDYDIIIIQVFNRFKQLNINLEGILNDSKKPCVYMIRSDVSLEFFPAKYFIANSKYIAEEYSKRYNIYPNNIFVLTPPVNNFEYNRKNERNLITMINPIQRKGGITFCNLARLLPDYQFFAQLGYGRSVDCLKKYRNITVNAPTDCVSSVYDKTFILLVPSLEEPFGRVALEGALSGCLIIANPIQGLKEVPLLEEFYVKDNNLGSWIEHIKRFMSLSNSEIDFFRNESIKKAESYSPDFSNLIPFLLKSL